MQKCMNLVELEKWCKMSIHLPKSVSIQMRTVIFEFEPGPGYDLPISTPPEAHASRASRPSYGGNGESSCCTSET